MDLAVSPPISSTWSQELPIAAEPRLTHSAASSTRRAIGAADFPPAPAPTSITATATRGLPAGAKATNQASVFFGSGLASAVGRSSAVPVLPATSMPRSVLPA
jgi:hypothetical protein